MRTRRCMSVEMLYPLDAELICCPAVIAYCYNLVCRDVVALGGLVLLTR